MDDPNAPDISSGKDWDASVRYLVDFIWTLQLNLELLYVLASLTSIQLMIKYV